MSFFKKLFCRHRFKLLSWGNIKIIDFYTEVFCGHDHDVTIGCVKCGKIRRYKKKRQDIPLCKEEMAVICVGLLGRSKWDKDE